MRKLFAIGLFVLLAAGTPGVVLADDADDQFALATGHYVRANYEFAAEELQIFLRKYPQDGRVTEARFYLGESFSQLQRFADAAAAYQRYLADRPQGRHARVATFRVAECWYFSNNSQAEAALQSFIDDWPNDDLNNFARPYLANCIAKRDEHAAIEAYREVLRQQPQSPLADECRIGLARCLDGQDGSTEARRIFQALAAKENTSIAPKALYFLARSYFASADYEESEQTFAELLQNYGQGEWVSFARLGLARSIFEQHRLDEAVTKLEQLIDDPRVNIDARYWLGLAHKRNKNYVPAIQLLRPLAAQAPQHELADDALFHAADALRVLNQHEQAGPLYQQLIEQYKDSTWQDDARLGLARLALVKEQHQLLERQLAPLYEAEDLSVRVQARRLLARSYLADEDFQRAVRELEFLRPWQSHDDKPGYTQYLLATAYAKANQTRQALAVLERLDASALENEDVTNLNLAAERAFSAASLHLSAENFAAASTALESFLELTDASDRRRKLASGELAVCLIKQGLHGSDDSRNQRVVQAMTAWRESPATDAAHHQLALRVAESLYAKESYAWAAEVFAKNLQVALAAKSSSQHELIARNRSGLGWSLYQANKPHAAAAAFEDLLQIHPESKLAAEAAVLLAQLYEDRNLSVAAQAAYLHIIDHHPDSPFRADALLSLAQLSTRLQNLEVAAELYETFLADYPTEARRDEALYQSAWLAKDAGDAQTAAAQFQRLYAECDKSPYWPDAAYRVADAQFSSQDYAAATTTLSKLLQHSDQRMRPFALFLQGKIAWEQERYADVVLHMDQLSGAFPTHELALTAGYFAADALTAQNENVAAAKRWEQLSALAATQTASNQTNWSAKIALRRVQSLAALRRWPEAQEIAEQALAAWPNFEFNYEHNFVIGRALASGGRLTDARDAYQLVLASSSGAKTETAAKAQLMIAETYFFQENFDQAVREYLKVEILYGYRPWQAAGLFQAGVCYEKLGKPDRAREHYRRLVRDYADTEYGQRAEDRLR